MVHVAHPQCGRQGFAQWLLPPPGGPAKPLAGTLLPLSQLGATTATVAKAPLAVPRLKPAVKQQPSQLEGASRAAETAAKFRQQARFGVVAPEGASGSSPANNVDEAADPADDEPRRHSDDLPAKVSGGCSSPPLP